MINIAVLNNLFYLKSKFIEDLLEINKIVRTIVIKNLQISSNIITYKNFSEKIFLLKNL
jgi:hypothetical protein